MLSAESSDGAATITRKASQAYRSLSASDKAALKDEGVSKRQPMTRAEMKRRAEKIGRKIQQLVCKCVILDFCTVIILWARRFEFPPIPPVLLERF